MRRASFRARLIPPLPRARPTHPRLGPGDWQLSKDVDPGQEPADAFASFVAELKAAVGTASDSSAALATAIKQRVPGVTGTWYDAVLHSTARHALRLSHLSHLARARTSSTRSLRTPRACAALDASVFVAPSTFIVVETKTNTITDNNTTVLIAVTAVACALLLLLGAVIAKQRLALTRKASAQVLEPDATLVVVAEVVEESARGLVVEATAAPPTAVRMEATRPAPAASTSVVSRLAALENEAGLTSTEKGAKSIAARLTVRRPDEARTTHMYYLLCAPRSRAHAPVLGVHSLVPRSRLNSPNDPLRRLKSSSASMRAIRETMP